MPMPHRTQMQLIKRRLVGKDGGERIKELRKILTELPNYKNGPYADIRKWVNAQIEESRTRRNVVHRDSIAVRREGVAQIALVGPPNAGKSSLLQALSAIQIKTGDYAFTTTRPVSSVTRIHDVPVQLVEIPGLLEGAHGDRGGGRALLGVLRGADAMVLCHEATAPVERLRAVRRELQAAGIGHPAVVAVTKLDEAADGAIGVVARETGLRAVGVSVLDDESLDALRDELWRLTGLIRVFLRRPGEDDAEPIALRPPATVRDAADAIHHEVAAACAGARIWGPSARFGGQRVGPAHPLDEDDLVEVITRR
ncbi:MAG TPA: GTPase [Gaiellaceae bacterium]|nr:GTPase [Gaiellaceae bacterium]